jgi:hypothetical protein
MKRDAFISICGKFRYSLLREWDALGPKLLFVMLNPSTADAAVDDPTIRRCISFAQAEGFGSLEVVNLFAYRATDPAELRRAGYPVGPDADWFIEIAATQAEKVCLAYGSVPAADERIQQVLPILRRAGREPQCLHITKSGYPGHPLYLASAKRLRPYDPAAINSAMEG